MAKYCLDLTDQAEAVIKRLAQKQNTTPANVLLKAIALLELTYQMKEDKESDLVWTRGGVIVARLEL